MDGWVGGQIIWAILIGVRGLRGLVVWVDWLIRRYVFVDYCLFVLFGFDCFEIDGNGWMGWKIISKWIIKGRDIGVAGNE